MRLNRRIAVLAALLAAFGVAPLRVAKGENDADDQAVARIAFLQGKASYNRGDDPDDWQPARQNFPLATGDRFWTSQKTRAELQLLPGEVFLGPETDLSLLNLTEEVCQLSVGAGTASFRIRRLASSESFEVATPNAAVTILEPGYYRIDVDDAGTTKVSVRRGTASVAAAGGEVRLEARDAVRVEGIEWPHYDVMDVSRPDSWDRWVEDRARRYREVRAEATYSDIVGIEELDRYGRWEEIPEYGRVWTPASVAVGWVPYRVGAWVWRSPWGWTWVSTEPWGWAPYHYGRWVVWSSRWYWVPVSPGIRVRWAPAYVGFVGGGPGWSVSAGFGGGYVGWFPLAPREPFLPWWPHRHVDVNVNVTNVRYVNRGHATVVNQQAFVSGASVAGNVVRDREIVRRIEAGPIAQGPLPVAPGRDSLHVATTRTVAAPQPPVHVLSRSVVSKMPPPPAPMPFQPPQQKDSPSPAVGPPRPAASRSEAGSPLPAPAERPSERKAVPRDWQTDIRAVRTPEAKPAPEVRRADAPASPSPETKAGPPSRRADVRPAPTPAAKALPPERKSEVRDAAPAPTPLTKVRPAHAEKVQLQPRGDAPQRRKVEPVTTESPAKKVTAPPEKKKSEDQPKKKEAAPPEKKKSEGKPDK